MWRATELMAADRRRTVRYATNGVVHIQSTIGGPVKDCRLTDISDGGVRLYAEGLQVPDDFHIWLTPDNVQRRRCRVVWRLGHEVGAEFTDQAQQDFGKQAALAQFGTRRGAV